MNEPTQPTEYTYPDCRAVADHAALARLFLKTSQAHAANVNAHLERLRERLRAWTPTTPPAPQRGR